MKYLCEQCAATVELVRFSVDGAELEAICPLCAGLTRSKRPVPKPASDIPPLALRLSPPEGHCFRCISKTPDDAKACPRCGANLLLQPSEAFTFPEELLAQWRVTLAHWQEPARHKALLGAASLRGQLAELARLYRLHLAWEPNDELARKGVAEVLNLASVAPLVVAQETAVSSPSRWKRFAAGALLLAMAAALATLLSQLLREAP